MNKLAPLYFPDTGEVLQDEHGHLLAIEQATDDQLVTFAAQYQEHRRRDEKHERAAKSEIKRRLKAPRDAGGWGNVDAIRIAGVEVTLGKRSEWDVEDLTTFLGELIAENLLSYAERELILKRVTEVKPDGNRLADLRRHLPEAVKPRLDACRTFARSLTITRTAIDASAVEERAPELEAPR